MSADPPMTPTKREYERAARLREELLRFLRTSDQITRKHGLTTQRYQLLLMVKTGREGNERASLSELKERLQIAHSTVVELVQRAEELGLVARELSPTNRRFVYAALTDRGRGRLAAAVGDLARARARLASILASATAAAENGPSVSRGASL